MLLAGFDCRYIAVPDLLLEIRSSFDQKSGTVKREKWFIERYGNVEFAFFDDLGAEYVTEWTESIIYLILNRRIGKKTVVTSNLDLDKIEKIFSGRISSRLIRFGPAPILFEGDRYRLRRK
jgi:DNA replication protein DnaC